MRLHRQYGTGLRDLSNPSNPALFATRGSHNEEGTDPATGKASGTSGAGSVDNGDGTETINGLIVNVKSWKAFPLGLVSGLQYNNETNGKCFYAVLDTVQFADYFEKDLQAFWEEGDFY